MNRILSSIPETDPLAIPEKRATIDGIVAANRERPGAAMVVLNEVQEQIGYISEPMQAYLAHRLGLPLQHIYGVVTFYSFFATEPKGRHTIKFCTGTACYVGGVQQLIEKAKQTLGIEIGQTTSDGLITLTECRCVGACSQAPVVVVDDDLHGRAKPNKVPKIIRDCQQVGGA